MTENLENAKEELKRIDHLIYVTLKYTRTVDVLLSVVERMINSYEFVVDALVQKAFDDGKIAEIPGNPIAKAHAVLEYYDVEDIRKNIQKYLLFRKLRRVTHDKSSEFRRHVTMTSVVDEAEIKVDIDSITEDFHTLKKCLETVEKIVK
ncbi:TPA: hypothetical protein HA239_03065 [Candidatus Woesearchaeota archaeon]|nr:hypothetical protein QT06_C0001G0687 [archaeon GW2011_AR15]MBS3103526.1 hypothetical protein [Candidatus Woesearchaeota archaeon]HIH41370.1 hypothetical protein [Candidatus Woesearchaeota archaeon]